MTKLCSARLAAALVATLAAASGAAHATVLTFEGLPGSQLGGSANPGYGDRATAAGPGVGSAGGATPNIVLDFVPTDSSAPFSVYGSGYGSLLSALGHSSFNVPGYVQFTPDAGWDVVLNSFDIASWSSSAYPNSRLRVEDTTGKLLWDTGSFTFAGATTLAYAPQLRSTAPLRLYVNDFGDLGLDNLQFGQVATIPEPGTWAMFLAGAALMGAAVRRQRKAAD